MLSAYPFKSKLWKHRGPAAWYFVTLPKSTSSQIRKSHGRSEEGWGRLKVAATVGDSSWATAIWFDTKRDRYLLPIKASVRKSEDWQVGDSRRVIIKVENEDRRISRL